VLHAVTIPGEENPHPAARLVDAARVVGIRALQADTVETALRDIIAQGGPARVLICGSLHLAGVILADNG
jgi:dihydrofolate synthase/folylpolyglutamate synthase